MTKTCCGCHEEKELSQYGKASRNLDGLNYRCKQCYSNYRREWYSKNSDKHKTKVYKRRGELFPEIYKWLGDYLKAHPCVDCGNSDILVLEFDHINSDKKDNVGSIARSYANISLVKKEVSKCEVRCVNCHRKITNKRRKELKNG